MLKILVEKYKEKMYPCIFICLKAKWKAGLDYLYDIDPLKMSFIEEFIGDSGITDDAAEMIEILMEWFYILKDRSY